MSEVVPESVLAARRRVSEIAARSPTLTPAHASSVPEYLAIWRRIHRRAIAATPGFDVAAEQAFLLSIADELPCSACERHWRAYLAARPMAAITPAGYFAWTVAAHNAISRGNRKGTWSVDQARAAWSTTSAAA